MLAGDIATIRTFIQMDVSMKLDLTSTIGSPSMLLVDLRYVANPHFHFHARLPPHTRQL